MAIGGRTIASGFPKLSIPRQARINISGVLYHVKARAVFVNIGIDYLGLCGSRFEKELKVSLSGISKLYRRGEEVTKNEPKVIQRIIS